MDATGWLRADLARAAGVTEAAVTHWLNGDTRSLKGVTAAKLETKSGFRAAWLATGKGQKLVDASAEHDMLLPKEVELISALRDLTDEEQARFFEAITQAAQHNRAVVQQHMRRMKPAAPGDTPSE